MRTHRAAIVAILLDLTMPGMPGEETFRRLKAIRTDVPIIVCSGYSEDVAIRRLPNDAINGFLQKPVRMEALQLKLEEVMSSGIFPAGLRN